MRISTLQKPERTSVTSTQEPLRLQAPAHVGSIVMQQREERGHLAALQTVSTWFSQNFQPKLHNLMGIQRRH
jgi:hypothetical protein